MTKTQILTEQQPEVELEFEIVTKEEYESHLDTAMSQDEFDAELQNPTGEEPTNPFEEQTEEENPFEEQTDNVEPMLMRNNQKKIPFEEQTEDIDEELKDQ